MFKDITIGQYIPTGSIVHKLDPRIKIIIVILYMVGVFLINRFVLYIPLILGLILISLLAKIPFSYLLKGIKPLRLILILTFIINAFATPGEEIFSIWILSLTKEGLFRASFMAIRLILLVMGTSLLTLTTSPVELTHGLESLFSPLKRIGFPAHEISMMLTIALRFIPTLIEETDKIIKAQKSRGADFESGNIINRAKGLIPLLVPLFINSLRRADDLATAMESRCYNGGEGRTSLKEYRIQGRDILALTFVVLYLFTFIILGRLVQ